MRKGLLGPPSGIDLTIYHTAEVVIRSLVYAAILHLSTANTSNLISHAALAAPVNTFNCTTHTINYLLWYTQFVKSQSICDGAEQRRHACIASQLILLISFSLIVAPSHVVKTLWARMCEDFSNGFVAPCYTNNCVHYVTCVLG